MNRKKGFTLVELLAVIAILAIILTILAPSLLNGIKSKKEDALNKIYDLIETAARSYVMDYDIDTPTIIQMEDLCETTYIECPILNPETEEELNGYVFAGNDYFYGEEESIKLKADFDIAEPNQTFSESYAPGTVIELQNVSKESYTYLGWEVVEGNSVIKDNKLTIGTTKTTIKPKLVRYLNDYIKYLYNDESTLNNGLVQTYAIVNEDEVDAGIRYAGATSTVKNKVYFNCAEIDGTKAYGKEGYNYNDNCEIWRIIGLFDTKLSETDTTGTPRIKIVRDKVLSEKMVWDSDSEGRMNQWGETTLISDNKTVYPGASLMQYLNGNTDGNYYYSLTSIAKSQINDALWYTGASAGGTASEVYKNERSNLTGKDTRINYTTTWVGKIGLIYLSDFGYAGTNCGDYAIGDYDNESSCGKKNNWLKLTSNYWTITAVSTTTANSYMLYSGGRASAANVNTYRDIRPTLYLDSKVQIIGGNGDNEPYILNI